MPSNAAVKTELTQPAIKPSERSHPVNYLDLSRVRLPETLHRNLAHLNSIYG